MKLRRFLANSLPVKLWTRFGRRWPFARQTIVFISAWALLNVMLNLRLPAEEPNAGFLLPSLDLAVCFGAFAVIGMLRRYIVPQVPRWSWFDVPKLLLALLAAVILFIRVYRVGDGMMEVWQSRHANFFSDITMLGELARLLHSTLPSLQFVGLCVAVALVVPLLLWVIYGCLLAAQRSLGEPKLVAVFFGVVGVTVAVSVSGVEVEPAERYSGVFTKSLTPRVVEDWQEYRRYQRVVVEREQELQATARTFGETTGDLARLDGANVILFIVESYGEVAFKDPRIAAYMNNGFVTWQASLDGSGYHVATRMLDSSVIGGFSWLAHASLFTGLKVSHQGHYKWLRERQPKTLMDFFRDADYRIVAAEPGTTRAGDPPYLYRYDVKFYQWHFGYAGPKFSWAPMPDQYVIDRVHRATASHPGPQFTKYALVSSHGPWNMQPPYIHNWDQIKDGEIYNRTQPVLFPTSWTDFTNAKWPYARSILYTLNSIREYMDFYVDDDTLVIIVGDHQPTTKFTRDARSAGVPIHILSRNEEWVNTFVEKRGYEWGLIPDRSRPRPGVWTFPVHFVEDFSTPRAADSPQTTASADAGTQ